MTTPSGSDNPRPHPLRPRLLALLPLGVLAALVLSLVAPLPTARADISYLCQGYDSCKQRGYPHARYKQNNDRMYWRMYSGHNCTNYAAYRMVRGGMSNERPWDGGGNAMYWGTEMRRITDDRPMVGAVAWWRANVPGAGSVGHVAFVERVVSRRKIVVSEDSWGGDFGWKTVTRGGSGWPSGFIHFDDRAVRATRAPAILGTPAVGRSVRVDTGRWRHDARVAVQWYAGGDPVADATRTTFTPTVAERRKRLAVRVTATRRGYLPGSAHVVSQERVARGTLRSTGAPTIEGRPRVDERLVLRGGGAAPRAENRSFRWFADGERIRGADTRRLRLTQDLIRSRITAAVVSGRAGYRNLVDTTSATARVAAGVIRVEEPFRLRGRASRESTLSVDRGAVRPRDAKVRYTWLRDGEEIARASGASYAATTADVGHRLAVRVALSRAGYRDRTLTMRTDGPVTTRPTLRVGAEGRPRRAVVTLRVGAPGVESPGGDVTVRVGRRAVRGEVVDGRLRVVVGDLPTGRHAVRVRYAGTTVVLPAQADTAVRVPRR